MQLDELMDVPETAAALHLHTATIRLWIRQKRIPFTRLGRRVLFRACDLQKMIEDGYQPIKRDEQ